MAASQSRRFSLIGELNNTKETWRLRVRVIRCYPVPSWLNKNETARVEMVLLDEKNTKIQASFNDKLIRVFEPLIREGELYNISNFKVSENKDTHKACTNKWKINFHRNTAVRACSGVDIPKYGFEMVSFKDILEQLQPSGVFVDLIGILKSKSPIKIAGEGDSTKKKMTINLLDESERLLEILLWGDYVDQLMNYINAHPGKIVVVILQFAKIKYGHGISHVSNSFYTSRLFLNAKCDAVTSFLASFENLDESIPYEIEELEVAVPLTIDEEFSRLTARKYIVDFLNTTEPGVYAVAGTIVRVETQHDWSYPSCKTCASKVSMQSNGSFYCPKCKKSMKYVTPRFKVVYTVEDETGSTSFLLFCREMNQLIGKTATDLRDTLIQNNEDGLFPLELDEILQKQYLFKVSISVYNLTKNYRVYTVIRVTDDPTIMGAHYALLNRDEVDDGDDVDTQSACSSLPISQFNDNLTSSLNGENSQIATSEPINITPTKRGIEEVVAGELYIVCEEGQSSAVKPKVTVKAEKDGPIEV